MKDRFLLELKSKAARAEMVRRILEALSYREYKPDWEKFKEVEKN